MKEVLASLAKYNKFWVALLGSVVNVLVAFFPNSIAVQLFVAVLTVFGVYKVQNKE